MLLQFWKARCPMVVTELGITMSANFEQSLKQYSPMPVTLSPNMAVCSLAQLLNTLLPIAPVLAMVAVVSWSQL